jgi:glycosyl transferase, family 25
MLKTYIINMDRNTERLETMKNQFERLGIPFERFPAVDGRKISEQAFKEFTSTRPMEGTGDSYVPGGRQWTPGKMGCFSSHYGLWSIAARSQDRYTAIFEDDLHVSDSLKVFLQDDAWIPADCGLVRLEPSYNRIKLVSHPWTTIEGRKLFRVIPSSYEHAWPVCLGGYIISREVARLLVETPQRYHTNADVFVFNALESRVARHIVAGQLDPAPCIQDKFFHKDKENIVHKSEIEISKAPPPEFSLVNRLGKKLHSLRLVLLGYRRVTFKGN